MPGMLKALPVTVGTAPWGVSRTLAYCAGSPSFGRCLGYPVSTQPSPANIFCRKGNIRVVMYGGGALNRLKWLVHVLML